MKYIPLFDKILVEEIKEEETILTYTEDQFSRNIKARVIEIPKILNVKEKKEFPIKVGDIVYFNIRNAQKLPLKYHDYCIVNIEEVLLKEDNG